VESKRAEIRFFAPRERCSVFSNVFGRRSVTKISRVPGTVKMLLLLGWACYLLVTTSKKEKGILVFAADCCGAAKIKSTKNLMDSSLMGLDNVSGPEHNL
jgi:hypothetical protein